MGGGSSKQEPVKVIKQESPKKEVDKDAFANYGVQNAVKSRPSVTSQIESPVKAHTAKPMQTANMHDDDEPDDQRPSAIAK